jgi:hypothetical protein
LSPKVEHGWWDQFCFAIERGRAGYEAKRRDFTKLLVAPYSTKLVLKEPSCADDVIGVEIGKERDDF